MSMRKDESRIGSQKGPGAKKGLDDPRSVDSKDLNQDPQMMGLESGGGMSSQPSAGGVKSEALGIASLTENLREVQFPITKAELIGVKGNLDIELPGGDHATLESLIVNYDDDDEFSTMSQLLAVAKDSIRLRRLIGKESVVSERRGPSERSGGSAISQ